MMTEIFCPHCGGQMQIDRNQRLQSMLSCPYCGRKSLMQKTDDHIHLRGIILPSVYGSAEPGRGEAPPASADPEPVGPASGESAPASAMPVQATTATPAAATRVQVAVPTLHAAPTAAPAMAEPAASAPAVTAPAVTAPAVTAPAATADSMAAGEPLAAPAEPALERLVRLAQSALAAGQMLAFNSYARQANDCDPTDPRMYVLRARLIEEAHGFARATFLSPGWREQTPRQRNWIMAQHFATLNAAIACSPADAHEMLAGQAGILIARQIRETFVERARLRLGRRPFRGRFRFNDLAQAPIVVETCLAIDETIVPRVATHLLMVIREELGRLDPVLAQHFKRIGF